jgi:hypothetical protein
MTWEYLWCLDRFEAGVGEGKALWFNFRTHTVIMSV